MSRLEYGVELAATDKDMVTVDKRILRRALTSWAGPGLTSRQHKSWIEIADAIGMGRDEAGRLIQVKEATTP